MCDDILIGMNSKSNPFTPILTYIYLGTKKCARKSVLVTFYKC